jgi:DNA-binding CsgD family transcriptional regulator
LATLPLPATLTEAVLRHLDGLDREQRRVVDAAAVLGQRIPFDWLASVTGLGEDELVGILRELVGQGLIAEDEADVFSFRHALTREAVAGRLLARQRRRLHEKSLAALQEIGSDDWAALAHHAAGSGRWEEMIDAARRGAARYLRSGATYQALRLAEMALEEADTDLELLELATLAAWSVALPATALERGEQWRRVAEESGDPFAPPRALRVLARLRWETGDASGHRAAVEAARQAAEQLPAGEDRAWVANLLAESAMLGDRSEEAIMWADEALRLAGDHPSPALRAAVLVNKGSALQILPGREEEGRRLLLEGQAAAIGVEDHLSALRAAHNLVHGVFPIWPIERSRALLAQMAEEIERSGRQDWIGSWHLLRATFFAHVIGDLTQARAELDPVALPTNKRAMAVLLGAELALEAGDLAQCEGLLHLAESGPASADDADLSMAIGLGVRLAARKRSIRDVEAGLVRLADEMARLGGHTRLSLHDAWHHALVAALHGGLAPEQARRLIARTPVAPSGNSADPWWPDHLAGALGEAEGRDAEAVASYRLAAAEAGWRRSRPATADAHLGAARCLVAVDDRDGARQHALAAVALLEKWPGWRQDDARALLRRLGGPGAPEVASAASTVLTAREREVAILLAKGLTNGEVAARLYISTKTASVHVSNILRKLSVTNRAEAAAWVVRQGLG